MQIETQTQAQTVNFNRPMPAVITSRTRFNIISRAFTDETLAKAADGYKQAYAIALQNEYLFEHHRAMWRAACPRMRAGGFEATMPILADLAGLSVREMKTRSKELLALGLIKLIVKGGAGRRHVYKIIEEKWPEILKIKTQA